MKFIKLFLASLSFTVVIVFCIYFGIVYHAKGVFDDSWQHMIQVKYRRLKVIEEPKLIVISGSSSAFGLDQRLIEAKTGYKVANLGLQASIGPKYLCNLAKRYAKKGDIVLFAYEYGWWNKKELFESLRPDLLVSGIDTCFEMYAQIPIKRIPNFLGYIFEYRQKAKEYAGQSGTYSASSFDFVDGQMNLQREGVFSYNKERDGTVDFTSMHIDKECVQFFKRFKKQIESKGAKIYFTFPPVVDECVIGTEEVIAKFVEETKQMGIPVISSPTDYFFNREFMFDGFCHCNIKGEQKRTYLLIQDMIEMGVVKY